MRKCFMSETKRSAAQPLLYQWKQIEFDRIGKISKTKNIRYNSCDHGAVVKKIA